MSEKMLFVRCDKRTFERAFWNGAVVLVNKGSRAEMWEATEYPITAGHTVTSCPDLLKHMVDDGPSRSGEMFGYYVGVVTR